MNLGFLKSKTTRSKALILGLSVSICFNILFAYGYFRARSEAQRTRTPEGRAAAIAVKLNLSPEQQERFRTIQTALRDKLNKRRGVFERERSEILQQISSGDIDAARIQNFMNGTRNEAADLRKVVADHMVDFVKVLTPEQRAILSDLARRKRFLELFI